MARRLLTLALLAATGATLAACDNQAANVLASAQPGQCYKVAGKNNLGQPKLEHAECGTPGAVSGTADAASGATVASTGTSTPASMGAACTVPAKPAAPAQPVAPPHPPVIVAKPASPPACAPAYSAGTSVASTASTGLNYGAAVAPRKHYFWRQPARPVRTVRVARTAHVVRKQVRERTYVQQSSGYSDYVPKSGEVYSSSQHYDYARPTQSTELAGGYNYRHQETYSAPPPPPPPPVVRHDDRRYESREYQGGYQGQYGGHAYDSRAYDNRAYGSSAYSSSSQSYASSSSRYASSSQGGRRKPCNCSRDRRPVIIQEGYERDGYLTWPGKSGY